MKASGVNFSTKARLKILSEEGYTAAEISSDIQVEEVSVRNWMASFGFNPNQGIPDEELPPEEEEEEEEEED